jgi:hypothetical protein
MSRTAASMDSPSAASATNAFALAPGRFELRDEPGELRLGARDEGEPVAERCELAGGRRADAGARAEDDGGLAE